jgi:hypothetical protein
LLLLAFISAFQNTKRPKIFPLFLSICFFSFLPLVSFTCYFRFGISKIQKYFALFAVSFHSCFKNQKPKNICCSSSVLLSLLQSSVSRYSIGAWYSLYIIQATSEEQ